MALRSQASLEMAAAKEAVVRRMVDALQRADDAAINDLVGDEILYHFPGRSPVAGTYRSTHGAERGGRPHEWNVARIYHVDGDRIGEIWLMIDDVSAFDAWIAAT